MCYTAQFLFLYDGLWWKWPFTLKNVSKNDWKLIIEGVGIKMPWVEKMEKLTIGWKGGTIIWDSRVHSQGWLLINGLLIYKGATLFWWGLSITGWSERKKLCYESNKYCMIFFQEDRSFQQFQATGHSSANSTALLIFIGNMFGI